MCRYAKARDCYLTMGRGSALTLLRSGWRNMASSTSAARPPHPQTRGKIERWHQTMKNRILLENYDLPRALEAEIAEFVEQYNHQRYHESLSNLTPADVYFGRRQTNLREHECIKRRTSRQRRLMQYQNAA